MAIKKQVVDGGRRTILRHTSGKKKGELAGSLPSTPPPNAVPKTPNISRETQEDEDSYSVSAAYERFLRSNSEAETIEAGDDFTLMQDSPTLELAQHTSALVPHGLDEDQHRDVFLALSRSVKRWDPAPQEPTDEEWNTYLLTARARITDPTNGLSDEERERALAVWEKAKANGKPDAQTFALASSSEKRMWRAKYMLRDHSVQIASWYDADPATVEAEVAKYRAEFYARKARGEEPSVPPKYAASWRRTGGSAPKDPATIYAHYHAETTSEYTPEVPPQRYVALDLETTGLSIKDSHIIEVGLVEYDKNGNEKGRWSQLVRPPLDENGKVSTGDDKVVSVHNIHVEDVIDQPTFDEILPELQDRLAGSTLIGHNLGFDTKHLRVSMQKFAPEEQRELASPSWQGEADTLFHASRHMEGLENNKLATVADSLGISYTNGHRAEHDAAVAGEVFFKIRNAKGWGAREEA
jgi:DNA polymerase III epsilon subunit-like protein